MLFVVDSSIEALLSGVDVYDADVDALDLLAVAVAEGKHRMTGARGTLRALFRQTRLHRRTHAVLHEAITRVEADLALQDSMSVYALVNSSNAMRPTSEFIEGKRIVNVPLRWIDDSEKVQPTILLAENLVDASILENMVRAVREFDPTLGIPIRSRHLLGGGQTTAAVFNELATRDVLCACVVDSDRRCPLGPAGNTAKALQDGNDLTRFPMASVVQTIGMDLENTLPDLFFEEVYGNDVNHTPTIAVIKRLTELGERDARSHLDLKKGLTLRDVFKGGGGLSSAGILGTQIACDSRYRRKIIK